MKKYIPLTLFVLILFFAGCSQSGVDPVDSDNDNDDEDSGVVTLAEKLSTIPDIELDLIVSGNRLGERYLYTENPSDPFDKEEWLESDLNIFYECMLTDIKNTVSDYINENSPEDSVAFLIEENITLNTDGGDFPFYVHAGKYVESDTGVELYATVANSASDTLLRVYINHNLEEGDTEYTTEYFLSQAEDDSDLNYYKYVGETGLSIVCEEWSDIDGDTEEINLNYYEFEVVDSTYSNLSLYHEIRDASDTETVKNSRLVYTRAAGYYIWQKEFIQDTEQSLFFNMDDGALNSSFSEWPTDFIQGQTDWISVAENRAESVDIAGNIPAADSVEFADLY